MRIAIIGTGNIGGILARRLSKHDHQITLGLRNVDSEDGAALVNFSTNIKASSVEDAAAQSNIIIIAVPFSAVPDAAKKLGDVKGKIIIETTNPFGKSLPGYKSSLAALKEIANTDDVVKCFNSIGAESLDNPHFQELTADNFVAGNSAKAKEIAILLSKELGFANCYDLGGDESVPIVEGIAQLCLALAYNAKMGRRVAFKILH